jgi:hypothetical protein
MIGHTLGKKWLLELYLMLIGPGEKRKIMPKCSISACGDEVAYEAILDDFYPPNEKVFLEQDVTYPFICL